MSSKSIYLNQSYMNFELTIFQFPVLVTFYPLFYVVPTTIVIVKMTTLYVRDTISKRTRVGLDPQMFLVITMAHATNLLFFFADFFTNRIPSAGLITRWCAHHDYGRILIIMLIITYYLLYISMGVPCLVSLMRVVVMVFPLAHKQVNARILKYLFPLLGLSPICSIFWLFPARGELRQLYPPYPFGSVFIHYTGQISNFRHTPFLIANIFIWFGTTIILSIILLIKVLNAPKSQFAKSKKRRMAELSVSLTTAAIVFSGLTAVIFMFLYLFFPWIASYLLIIKPLGADCPVVVPVWIFWRTMPAFRKRRSNAADKNARGAGGTVSVVNVSGAYRIGLVK